MYILHNWKIIHRANSSGEETICVGGKVYGNARFGSGEPITTSSIAWYRFESGSAIVSTRNGSEYMLGKPSASEPFAKQRLIRYLEERGRQAVKRAVERGVDEHTQRMRPVRRSSERAFMAAQSITSIGDTRFLAAAD